MLLEAIYKNYTIYSNTNSNFKNICLVLYSRGDWGKVATLIHNVF